MPAAVINVHPYETLTLPDGGQADIDLDMVPLVRALWTLGLRTAGCCQDLGESVIAERRPEETGRRRHADYLLGRAWLKMPSPDAMSMLSLLAERPHFAERFGRWTHPDAWDNYVYLLPGENGTQLSPWAQIHFPKPQLAEVIEALAH
ncbi:hypothetical protein [Actinomadura sp. 9N407]|uniref:hypothetical protein n=1 Tax=Actinomadura sp. 9N407 TaxID=3375154 RepID=UPI00378A7893